MKKLIVLVMILALTCGLLSSCIGGAEPTAEALVSNAEEVLAEAPYTLTMKMNFACDNEEVNEILSAMNMEIPVTVDGKNLAMDIEMSMMGELRYFLGLQIHQSKEGIFINQSKYCKELLKKIGMQNAKEISTPMSTSCYLDKDEGGKSVDESKYRGMIGSLLYLTASRPDIMFSVCMCARFQANPKESHLCGQTHNEISHWHTKYGFMVS
jgi:hypothetical protein